jgi:polysaccharide chain length determinant protein (PEP-CTERM system associated)
VVQAIVELFIESGSSGQKRDSEDASRFIDEQIKTQETKLSEAENRLKDFKIRNFGVSGVSNQDYFTRMSALSDEVNRLRVSLQAAEQSRDALRRELQGEEPQLPVEAMPTTGPISSEVDARLETQRKLLDDLLRRYTDEHPDVVSTRRMIAQLEAQKQQELDARTRASRQGRGPAATSPVYQRIRVSLAETEASVASLRSQLSAQQTRLEEVRAVAGRVPQVEAELAQLNRDYDVIRRNYEQLVSRRESASLGVKLDETSHLADFRVVEPPRVAPQPVFPSRFHLAVISVLFAAAAGVMAALGLEFLRPTFQDSKALQAVSRRPVLGGVSLSVTAAGLRRVRFDRIRWFAAGIALLMLQSAWVVWVALHRPL